MSLRDAAAAAIAAASLAAGTASASCGAAFCLVNTQWGVQGIWHEPGLRADLRYETIEQDQPRTGTRNVAVGEIPAHHDEVRTRNRNLLATFEYGVSQDLGLSLVVPWVDRFHEHRHNHHGAVIPEQWSLNGIGDVRLTARYQRVADEDARAGTLGFAGVVAGLKLPTGSTSIANAQGAVAERSLQPGSGTTDAILGAYYRQVIAARDASWFVQGTAQLPMNHRRDYRPGRQVQLDAGTYWQTSDALALIGQFNALWRGRDSGAEAEPADTGSRTVSASIGLAYAVTPAVRLYGSVQRPLYQRVNGVQLVADYSFTLGLNAQF